MAGMLTNAPFWLAVGGMWAMPVAYLIQRIPLRVAIGTSPRGRAWRVVALLFAITNLKSLPTGWHLRLLKALLAHVSLIRGRPPQAPGPAQLFQPLITSSSTSLLETDYNIHKSNSTYFSDLDVARMHHVAHVFAKGMYRARFGLEGTGQRLEEKGNPDPKGKLNIMLGGVTCNFRKELKPYVSFETWTRVLAWDRKWLYIVSHIVKAGTVKPSEYTMQAWRNSSLVSSSVAKTKKKPIDDKSDPTEPTDVAAPPQVPHSAIIATSIAKYVFKRGRWTLPPEVAMENSGLLPPRPEHVLSESELLELTDSNGTLWDWERVEWERARGMAAAQHMADLDSLLYEFSGDGAAVLGRW